MIPNKLDQAAVVLENWQVCWDPKLQFLDFVILSKIYIYILGQIYIFFKNYGKT